MKCGKHPHGVDTVSNTDEHWLYKGRYSLSQNLIPVYIGVFTGLPDTVSPCRNSGLWCAEVNLHCLDLQTSLYLPWCTPSPTIESEYFSHVVRNLYTSSELMRSAALMVYLFEWTPCFRSNSIFLLEPYMEDLASLAKLCKFSLILPLLQALCYYCCKQFTLPCCSTC